MLMNLPLPEPDVSWVDGVDKWDYVYYRHAYSATAMRSYGEACAAAEMERIIRIIEAYKVPVGNSRSGELAAEWTMGALRDIRAAICAGGETCDAGPWGPCPTPDACKCPPREEI